MKQTSPTVIPINPAPPWMFAVVFAAALMPWSVHSQNALEISNTGNVGMGIVSPERQLHLRGSDAVFRMDRPVDTAAFMLVRTNTAGTPLKTFVVGANAAGTNNGEFVINDLGAAVSGSGTRRLTITNGGDVLAKSFIPSSSRRFKENVEPLADALGLVRQLQGVRFVWKDSGRPALGLIAEDVATVLPEVVERDAADGQTAGVNYMALVAVLVEAVKTQQAEIATLQARQAELESAQAKIAALADQVAKLASAQARAASLEARLAEIESLLTGGRLPVVLTQR